MMLCHVLLQLLLVFLFLLLCNCFLLQQGLPLLAHLLELLVHAFSLLFEELALPLFAGFFVFDLVRLIVELLLICFLLLLNPCRKGRCLVLFKPTLLLFILELLDGILALFLLSFACLFLLESDCLGLLVLFVLQLDLLLTLFPFAVPL